MKKFVKFALLAIVLIILAIGCAACGGGSHPAAINQPRPVKVVQPPSAADVAAQLNCTQFVDHGPSQMGGSIDSGSCYIGGVKYAINTFPSQDIRDSWLKAAEQLGVNPQWETATSVTYKSVTGN